MSHLRILYLSALGADEQAYDIIEADLVNGSESFVYVWRADDDSLRRHARFKPLARQLGLPAYWREKGFPEGCVGVGVDDFECR